MKWMSKKQWKWTKRALTWLFLVAVAVLLVLYARKIDWHEVWNVIRDYNRLALLGAVGLVIFNYLLYGCYDLLARVWCGHKLAKRQVMLVSFICYAFNLTLSTWVGGIGMRYRLYSRLGLKPGYHYPHLFPEYLDQLAGLFITGGRDVLPVAQLTCRRTGISTTPPCDYLARRYWRRC
jgi:Predicted integral membrane protein